MRKASQEPSYDNYIEQKLQRAFGYSDDQLLTEFAQAEAQPEDPDLLPPKDEWRKLLERVNDAEKKKQEDHKVLRLKRIAKPLILVAVLGAILVGTGIGASGKRGFEYWTRELSGSGNRVIWNNNEDNLVDVSEAEAYQKIENELGIDTVMLGYLPKGTVFDEVNIMKSHARLSFLAGDKYIHIIETLYNVENSSNTVVDNSDYIEVTNESLNQTIFIEKNVLDNNLEEFGARFESGKAYYYIVSTVEEEEFLKIVRNLRFY